MHSFKFIVGVAPNAVITNVSKLYPGSIPDRAIVQESGLHNQLPPGDLVLADKGFLIQDMVSRGVSKRRKLEFWWRRLEFKWCLKLLFSPSFYPLISKPTRITRRSETSINNIFVNSLVDNFTSGLLSTDLSDHLPIFQITISLTTKKKTKHRKSLTKVSISQTRN